MVLRSKLVLARSIKRKSPSLCPSRALGCPRVLPVYLVDVNCDPIRGVPTPKLVQPLAPHLRVVHLVCVITLQHVGGGTMTLLQAVNHAS